MATPAIPHVPEPRRVEVNADGAAYSIDHDTASGTIGLRLYDVTGDDALVYFEPSQLVQLRADLSTALLQLGQGEAHPPGINSPAGQALLEQLRQVFGALVELDKHRSAEVDALCAVVVGHLRSWRPFVLRAEAHGGGPR